MITRYVDRKFSDLVGQTITSIKGLKKDSGDVYFTTTTGKEYKMYHSQDCCESVLIEDICGEVEDLIGSPILQAEENSSEDTSNTPTFRGESCTWTFYRIATIKGQVVIRWLGESNGYYSETVDFVEEVKVEV